MPVNQRTERSASRSSEDEFNVVLQSAVRDQPEKPREPQLTTSAKTTVVQIIGNVQ
jgi:hypothetical protein